MPQNKSRVLVVTTRSWTNVEPFVRSLESAGFTAALVHGQAGGHTLHDASVMMFLARPLQFRHTIERAMQDVAPDLVIPTDEPSFNHLREIYAKHGEGGGRVWSPLAKIIAKSFGDPAAHDRIASSAELQRFAREHGLPVPNAVAVNDEATLRALLESVPLPVMLKSDGGWGGPRGEIVRSLEAGIAAYHRVTGATQVTKLWKEQNTLHRLSDLLQTRQRSLVLQRYVDGVAAKRSIACRDGVVLVGVSVEPLDSNGPALVARIIEHPTMETIAAFAVKALNLSGFVDFDFMLEHGTRRAWLIAVKPYATPVSQMVAAGDAGLAAALHAAFATNSDRRPEIASDGVVMPFPRTAPRLPAAARAYLMPPGNFADRTQSATGTDGLPMGRMAASQRGSWAKSR